MTRRILLLTFAISIILSGCTRMRREPATITIDEATTVLDRARMNAQARDLDALCGLAGGVGLCRTDFQIAGGAEAVPVEPPKVVDSYILPDVGDRLGGRVLKLQGTDSRGQHYQSEFLVYDDGTNRLVALTPVYWLNRNIAQPGHDGSITTDR